MPNELSSNEFEERLRTEGVGFKDYGIVPKAVMTDTDLTIESKAIYAYFCAWAVGYRTAFPSREMILANLRIGEGRYYRHLTPLTEQGYITPSQQKGGGRKQGNIYTIDYRPPKYVGAPQPPNYRGRLWVSGIRREGYGSIPKAVMQDPRLTIESKGIYAYFASGHYDSYCAGGRYDDDIVSVRLTDMLEHLRISAGTYYKHYRLLTDWNYVTAVQRREGRCFAINDYTLNEFPDKNLVRRKHALRLL